MSTLPFAPEEVRPPPVPLDEQLREVRREIALRTRVYPRWIADGKVSKAKAEAALRTMHAVADTLAELVRQEAAAKPPASATTDDHIERARRAARGEEPPR